MSNALRFYVGHIEYQLVIADRRLYDREGEELEGCVVEARRLIVLSRALSPERREEVAFHEFVHAWRFVVPAPSDEEELCQFTAFVGEQWRRQLEEQGGVTSLLRLRYSRISGLGQAAPPVRASGTPAYDIIRNNHDRAVCGACGAETMCGSITNGDPYVHEATGQVRIDRWMTCEACGSVQTWTEVCTLDGTPLGSYIANPAPRLMHGPEAKRFISEKTSADEGCLPV